MVEISEWADPTFPDISLHDVTALFCYTGQAELFIVTILPSMEKGAFLLFGIVSNNN